MKSFKKLVIEKPHKYIRKWFENGEWHYEYSRDFNDEVRAYYREPNKGKNKQGGYGTIWGDYFGKPNEAFEKLFQERIGQCMNVFSVKLPVLIKKGGKFEVLKSAKTRKPILADTSIDLVWGDKTKNRGLEHIIDDHYVCHNDFSSIEELQSKIIEELSRLNYSDSSNRESQFFNQGAKMQFRIAGASGQKFVFVIQWGGMDEDGRCLFRHFILTSYDLSKGEVENSEEEREKRQKIFDEYGK